MTDRFLTTGFRCSSNCSFGQSPAECRGRVTRESVLEGTPYATIVVSATIQQCVDRLIGDSGAAKRETPLLLHFFGGEQDCTVGAPRN
jgi:hypothetical protein